MKVYVATTLSNAPAAKSVIAHLREMGQEVTYDWTAHGAVGHAGVETLRRVSAAEKKGVRDADVVVILLCGLHDPVNDGRPILRGTHWEGGYADALDKMIILFDPQGFPVDDRTCAFYWGENCFRVGGVDLDTFTGALGAWLLAASCGPNGIEWLRDMLRRAETPS